MTILNDTHVHVRRGHGQLRRFVKAPDRNFPINSHTLTNIRPRAGGNNDIMDTAGLLAERRRLWVGERKRRHVCGVCVLAWETLAAAGGKKPPWNPCLTDGDFHQREKTGRIDEAREMMDGEG